MNEKRLSQRLEWIKQHPEHQFQRGKLQRKVSHDYKAKGVYLITLCTEQRKSVLGVLHGSDERHEMLLMDLRLDAIAQ